MPRLHTNVTEGVIKKILLNLDTSKSLGMDRIPAKHFEERCGSIGSSFLEIY